MKLRLTLRWTLGVAIAVLLVVLAVRVLPFISLARLETHQRELSTYGAAHPIGMAAIFVALYVGFAALPLPGAEVLTIAAGALFGLVEGIALVSFASSIGAALAFLMSRLLLRTIVERRFSERVGMLSRGIEQEGAFYLFALRLIPIIPFFLINLLMGLTRLRLMTFYWVSQIGMLPATAVYVNAGLQLGQVRSLSGILSLRVLLSFAALGMLPLGARYLVRALRGGRRSPGNESN